MNNGETNRGGSYVIPVKENQKRLLQTIEEELERLKQEGRYEKLEGVEQINKSHGRIESIKGRLIQDTSFLYEKLGLDSFYGSIARIGVIEKETIQTGTGEVRRSRQVVITNLEEVEIEDLVKIRQGHWNIEMQHWLLDVQLREDQKTARKEGAMTSSAVLRRFCMMMKKYDEKKVLEECQMSIAKYWDDTKAAFASAACIHASMSAMNAGKRSCSFQ